MKMAKDAARTRLTAARVFIILGVLVSLCVSDNVGPRLLPLPSISERAPTPRAFDQGEAASRAPARARTDGARVEMVTAPQSRAGAERAEVRTRRTSRPALPEAGTLPAFRRTLRAFRTA